MTGIERMRTRGLCQCGEHVGSGRTEAIDEFLPERQIGAASTTVMHFLNGPNLNLLGDREPEIYGSSTLADVERACRKMCEAGGVPIEFRQTNSEETLINEIQAARNSAGIVINPGGCSYSVSVLDALKACTAPIVEVHISNIHAREEPWRAKTLTTAAALGVISGLGIEGYQLACQFLLNLRAASHR
jgi:3-dehydroquinate dehydratase-2